MIKQMNADESVNWVELLCEEDRLEMLTEIVELSQSCAASSNFDALNTALLEWEKRAYYYDAFKNQDEGMSEVQAMELALEAQQAARKYARG